MRVLLVFAAFGAVVVLGFVLFTVLLPSGTKTDCSQVSVPTADAWTRLDDRAKRSLAGRINRCSKLDGLTQQQVQAAFGAPTDGGTNQGGATTFLYELARGETADGGGQLPPDKWEITFGDDGKVADVSLIGTN